MSGRVFIITEWFSPGYKAGGPIRSIQNMVEALPFEFYILTTNRDWGSDVPYADVPCGQWQQHNDHTRVWYHGEQQLNANLIKELMEEVQPSVLYLNSMFSWSFTWRPILTAKKMNFSGKIILAPRGMLHPNAMMIKSLKKKLFLKCIQFLDWSKNLHWQATSEEEAKYIQAHFGQKVSLSITENLPTFSLFKSPSEQVKNRWLMVNRLSAEKGVLEGLQWWMSHPISIEASLTIIGPASNASYQAQVEKIIQDHPERKMVWLGDLPPARVTEWMQQSDFFYAPTRGENYGHAIAEALFMGLPAVVANGTPWQNLNEKKWGWNFAHHESALHKVLDEVMSLPSNQYQEMQSALQVAREGEIKKIHNSQSWILLFGTK